MNETSPYQRGLRDALLLSAIPGYNKKYCLLNQEAGPHDSASILVLDLPVFRAMRNKFVVYKPQVYTILS
jgi:hypothetical protein